MFLQNQVVLVTGASRGIGKAIAIRLAKEKPRHIVISYCMNYAAARQTVQQLEAMDVPASMISLDVSDEKMLAGMFAQVEQRFGRLDIFVNNAARTTFRPAMELNSHNWQRIMDINARAFLLGSQMAAGIMRKNGGGRIVGISSLGSQFYISNYAGLGAAKAVMESLARYLAVELAPWNINVNVVCGGFVNTESMQLAPDYKNIVEYVRERTPVKRLATPQDLAGVVAFLCSPDSDWIRGQTLVADGGFSLILG